MDNPRARFLWPLLMLGSLLTFTGAVYAANGPADPTTNTQDALQQFWGAVVSRRWGLAAVLATMCFVALARFVAPKIHGAFGTWIQSSRVSAALAFLGGLSSAIATQLFKGDKLSFNALAFGFGV